MANGAFLQDGRKSSRLEINLLPSVVLVRGTWGNGQDRSSDTVRDPCGCPGPLTSVVLVEQVECE